jgi:hypothetical protein
MFLKLGFKSITMDDIAGEMCISKKRFTNIFTIKNFLSKKAHAYKEVGIIDNIVNKKHNAIHENFEIRKMFKDMFQSSDDSLFIS